MIDSSILVARTLAGRALLVRTKVCVIYFAKLKRWLTTGSLGAVVYGRPRLGKTSGTRWVLGALQEAFGRVPYVEVPVRKQHLHNEGAFFQFLLKCCRHKYFAKGTVADKRDRLLEALLNRARRSSTRTVVVFLDEAQLLENLQYQWLQNISNELEMAGFRVFFLLVGQENLSNRRETLMLDESEQIVARFMTEAWSFKGLSSVTELKDALEGYDEGIVAHSTSKLGEIGKPFLEWFVPLAFANGFRLGHQAERIWQGYMAEWQSLGTKGKLELPMHYVANTVTNLLVRLAESDSSDLSVLDKHIVTAIGSSGFRNYVAILRAGKSKNGKRK